MNIKLIGHDKHIAVQQIMQLFCVKDAKIDVNSTLVFNNDNICAKAEIFCDGEIKAVGIETQDINKNSESDISNLIKKSVYTAAKKIFDIPSPWGISTGIRPAKSARILIDEGKNDQEIIEILKSEYWMSEEKANLSLITAHNEKRILKDKIKNSISLYIGIPFCPTRCSYCSFISQAIEHNKKFVHPYIDAVKQEIKCVSEIVKDMGLTVETVYFGGGTPTAILPNELNELLESVNNEFDLSNIKEFTVEAGRPDTFSYEMLDVLKNNSVSRISINPQTMHQETLDKIGRRHTPYDVERAFEMAHKKGFDNINADIIIGLPDETVEHVAETLDKIQALSPQAITVHTMYLKRAARINEEFEKYRFVKDTDQMMSEAVKKLYLAKMNPYYLYKQKNTLGNLENVGFSKSGYECLYNIYIMEEIQSIIAIGAGASTKLVTNGEIKRIFNPKDASDYIKRIDEIIEKKNKIPAMLTGKI